MTQIERLATMYPVKRLTSRIPKRIAAAGIVATLGFLAVAAYAMFVSLPGHIKVAPLSIIVHSSSSLPAEVQALEAQTAVSLFDRDTTTAHFAYADQIIDAQLEKQTEIKSVNIYGPSPYELTVQAQQGSSWSTIAGLDKIKLTSQPAAWNSFPATQPVTTGALRFVLTLPSGSSGSKGKSGTTTSTAGGIPEIEIWASGEHALLNGAALLAAMPVGTTTQAKPAQARAYTATPVSAVIGKDGQTFRFTLDRPTHRFKRAWLSYEAYGLSHWVSPVRRINGLSIQGGSFTFSGTDWTPLTEPIHPDWLVSGSNRIDFTLPANMAGNYSVRNVRVITELDDGNNFIARATTITGATAKQTGTEIDAPVLTDGDLTTGWSPYVDPRNKTGQPALTLTFDKPTQLDTLSLNLVNALSGTMSVDLLVSGQWQSAGLPTINGNKLTAGWNNLNGFAQVPADALRITFLNGSGSPGEIREIAASGSGTGTAYVPTINVAYPDAGQFYGREAYIRGFLSVPDNGSGPAAVAIAGKSIATPDGSFGLVVSKEDAGYASQADAEPWQVEVTAIYPDGKKLTQIVKLTQAFDAAKAHGNLPNAVNPLLLVLGDASLEIAPDATEEGIKIKITPLSEKDLPRLDPGMTNVTRGPHKGYRFTPTPYKFKKNIKVTLPFDSAFVPSGHTENDIKTYYFDTQAGHWVPLDRVLVDGGKKRITSLTNHFTDMINATLTVPDHPEAVSFNPTQIKDIKAADPGAGINLIEPPQANNNGDARLSYPIEIPQGRQGMQPQLAISYNSAGGNGWLGQGWDLSVPSISIETRWGVPRYDTANETETYLLNGEQLTPMAHRGEIQPRTAEKIFHTRVEGAFRKIIRHGDNPTNYWWEVTDKNGMKNFYGGTPETGKLVLTVLESAGGNGTNPGVFKWSLKKTLDTNGNSVIYDYDRVCDSGTGDGANTNSDATCEAPPGQTIVPGYQLYLKQVRYTEHMAEEGKYKVTFVRDSARAGYIRDRNADGYDPKIDRRPDVNINAMGGFKQVSSERLSQINVEFGQQLIRSYRLKYKMGAFEKTLLDHISQHGSDGAEFNRHAFEYHDTISQNNGTLALFAPTAGNVDPYKDVLISSQVPPLVASLLAYPQTLVGGSLGVNSGFSGFVGIGPPFLGKVINVGVTLNANASYSQSNLNLIDIDGDGMPDKVFERDGTVYYRKNTSDISSGAISFKDGEADAIEGIGRLGDTRSLSWGVGVKGQLFIVNAYANDSHSTTTDSVYFADVNGDGLVDQVNNRAVQFNYRNEQNLPSYSENSGKTQMAIGAGNVNATDLLASMAAERTKMENGNPLMDAVRRWVVPYDGRITISGDVQLHNFNTDPELSPGERDRRVRYEAADGVRVSIQHGNDEIWAANIGDIGVEDYTAKSPAETYIATVPAHTQGRTVHKGEVIYFRVHSKYDGNYDRVSWAPEITYVDAAGQTQEHLDANQRNAYLYRANSDFVLAGRGVRMVAPNYGTVKVQGQLQKTDITSDDITLQIELSDSVNAQRVVIASQGFAQKLMWNDTGTIDLNHTMEVEKGQSISIKLASDSPIDLTKLNWLGEGSPKIYYTYAYEPEVHVVQPSPPTDQSANSRLPGSANDIAPDPGKMPVDGGMLPRRDIPTVDLNGNPSILIHGGYDADIYPVTSEGTSPQAPWIASKDGVLLLSPWVTLKSYPDPNCIVGDNGNTCAPVVIARDGQLAFTVKRNGQLLAKQIIEIKNQAVVPGSQGYQAIQAIAVSAGDKIFIDFSVPDSSLASEIDTTRAHFAYGSENFWQVPLSDDVAFRSKLQANFPYEDGVTASPRTVMFVARRGTDIVERKELTLTSPYQLYEHPFTHAVQAGEKYSFDYLTIDPEITASQHDVWATYSGIAPWKAPSTGNVTVFPRLSFTQPLSGAVTLRVSRNGQNWLSQNYSVVNGEIAANQPSIKLDVAANDSLRYEYVTNDHALSSALSNKGEVTISYVSQTQWVVPNNWGDLIGRVTLAVQPQLAFSDSTTSGQMSLKIWLNGQTLATARFDVVNGQARSLDTLPLTVQVSTGDVLGFEYLTDNQAIIDGANRHSVDLSSGNNRAAQNVVFNRTSIAYGSQAFHIQMPDRFETHPLGDSIRRQAMEDPLYGSPYRGWTYIAYNSDHSVVGKPASKALVQGQLRMLTEAEIRDPKTEHPAYLAFPAAKPQRWESMDDNWWISASDVTASRRGIDQIDVPDPASFQSASTVLRVPRRSTGNTFSSGGGAYINVNFSNGTSAGELDLVDLNGDRFPDMIGSGNVQYTDARGGMAETRAVLSATNVTNTDGKSFSIGAASEEITTTSTGGVARTGNTKPKSPEKSSGMPFSVGIDSGNSQASIQLADINGDGLPDQLIHAGSEISVRLNLGYAFAPAERWGNAAINHSETVGFTLGVISYNSNDGKEQLMDINGDGLSDRVVTGSDGRLKVNFNTGNGFGPMQIATGFLSTTGSLPGGLGAGLNLPASHVTLYDGASLSASGSFGFGYNFTIACPIPCLDLMFGGGFNIGATITQPTIGLRDMNGDGNVDGLRSVSSDKAEVVVNQTGKTNLLKQVRRPLGARFDIDYIRTGNTYDQPQSKYVMAEVRMFDGVANDTPSAYLNKGTDWQRSTYTYTDGKYDRFERDFLGYKTVTSTQHDTAGKNGATLTANDLANTPVFRKTVQEYSNSHTYDKGLLQNETLFDSNGNPYVATVNTYDFWKLGDSPTQATDPLQLDRYTTRASATLFPRLTRTDKSFYEGQSTAGQSSYTEHGYDALGNVTDFAEGGTAVDPVSAHIAYTSCDSSYIVGKPKVITVNAGGQEMRRREGDFDCSTGNLNWQRAFIDTSRNAETKFTWDGYGNLFTIEGAENHQSQRMLLVYQYDADTNTYPVHVDNISYGISSSANYDLKWGKPLLTTDTNGNEISYKYDSVGRTQSVLGPQEKAAGKPWTIHFSYMPYLDTDAAASSKESWAKTEHADRSVNSSGQVSYKADTIDTVLFTDGTKRVLQTKKDASVSAGNGTAAQDMMIVSGRVAADALGRAIAQYYPTASTKGGSDLAFLKTEDDSAKPTETDYDVLDRAKSTTLPDDTTTTMDYGFGTDAAGQPRFSTTVRDANGNTKQSFRDVRELITSVVEENRQFDKTGKAVSSGKAKITTQYRYDPLKQITKVIDYNQNVTNVEYDKLGRRTVIDNPDTGKTETVYDDASNPIKKITANLRKTGQAPSTGSGQAIEYDYDYSRLVAIRHPLYPDTDVSYTYGTDADRALNQAGRVKFVKHQSGTETREYGSLGEVVKETIILTAAVPSNSTGGGSTPPGYTTQYDFDSFGRLHKLMMPDGEIITNHYDSGGNLNAVDGTLNGRPYQYLERLDYDRFESRVYLKVGNGVETSYRYDPNNRRLSNLKAGSPGKSAMQDMTYGYDAVGNIKSLIDDAPIPRTNEYGGKLEQSFDYDDLYRLVRADGEYTTAREVQNYKFAMAYDAIHNITHKTQLHTVSKIGGTPRTEAATTYDWAYTYKDPSTSSGQTVQRPHAPTHIGERSFDYDANGNQSGWQNDTNGSRRTIVWDEENRIREVQDPKHGASFTYNDQGERKLKKSKYGETAYINQFFTVRNGAIASTHVYAGTSRIVTKVGAGTPVDKSTPPDLNGTGNLSLTAPTGGDIVVGDTFTVGSTGTTIVPTTTRNTPSPLAGEGRGEGASKTTAATTTTSSFPGQGIAHRSDRANEVARNTEKNKHLNGGNPGGEHGSGNSNAGGNGNAAGTSNNPGSNNGGSTGGGNSGGSNAGGNGGGVGSDGNTNGGGAGQGNGREFIFFYHPDHLGSTGYVTDEKALRYEHITYFPFGETWVQESNATWRVPYQFTSKEMDQETGLYYFGARYYDPRTSVWQSPDPILGKYLEGKPNRGVFNSANLGLYSYTFNNPLRYYDPDGMASWDSFVKGVLDGGEAYVATELGEDFHSTANISPGDRSTYQIGFYLQQAIAAQADKAQESGGGRGAPKASHLSIAPKTGGQASSSDGRTGKQARLKELANDPKVSSVDRGWIAQEKNSIKRGQRDTIRVPPGKQLAHERGREAAKGYGYEYSNLQDKDLHKTQHKFDDSGRANKERPPKPGD